MFWQMFKQLAIIVLFLSVAIFASNETCVSDPKPEHIELTEYNHVTIKGVISEETATLFIRETMELEAEHIYVYLYTPGGSVLAGNRIIQQINTLQTMGKQISCIADRAMSMGFAILQACPNRLVLNNSLIMQHQMSGGMHGSIESMRSQFNFLDTLESESNKMQASRMNMTVEEFTKLYVHDIYLYGSTSILNHHAADRVVTVACNFYHGNDQTMTRVYDGGFFKAYVDYYMCPIIPSHVSMEFDTEDGEEMLANLKSFMLNYIMGVQTESTGFSQFMDYINSGSNFRIFSQATIPTVEETQESN